MIRMIGQLQAVGTGECTKEDSRDHVHGPVFPIPSEESPLIIINNLPCGEVESRSRRLLGCG